MPFITEEIWQRIREHQPEGKPASIMIAPYPAADTGAFDAEAEGEMESVIEIVRSIRNARMEGKVDPGRFIEAVIAAGEARPALEAHAPAIATLARVRPLTILDSRVGEGTRQDKAKILVLKGVEVILPLEGMIDVDAEKSRLLREIETNRKEISRIECLLADDAFLAKAPAPIVEKERQKLNERRDRLGRLEERLAHLG
jgi:valyl-tRNA synthetase